MVRKRVIDEPQNLNHNVVPKRTEIGRLTPDNAVDNAACRFKRVPQMQPNQKLNRNMKSISRGLGSPNRALVRPLTVPTVAGALMLLAGKVKFG